MASYFHIRRNVHGKWPLWVQLTWVLGSVDIPPSLQMFFPWEISDISVNTTLIFRVSVALRSSNWATEIPPFHRLQMGYPPVPCFIIVFPINFARFWDYINYIHHFSDTPTSPTSYIYNNIYIYIYPMILKISSWYIRSFLRLKHHFIIHHHLGMRKNHRSMGQVTSSIIDVDGCLGKPREISIVSDGQNLDRYGLWWLKMKSGITRW
jgi:hypothetical protein